MAFVLGLCGGSASGKSTVAKLVGEILVDEGKSVEVFGLDRFFRRDDPDAPTFLFSVTGKPEFNANDPEAVDVTATVSAIEGSSADVVVLEGHLLMAIDEVREACGLTVFFDLPDDVRAARRVARDIREKRIGGDLDSIVAYYVECARVGHAEWVAPFVGEADLVVDGMLPPDFLAGIVADAALDAIG